MIILMNADRVSACAVDFTGVDHFIHIIYPTVETFHTVKEHSTPH
jgi:hypothetical protein